MPTTTVRNPRGLKPRNRGQYTNEAYGRGGSLAPPDDMCINDSVGRVNVIRPRGKEGILWFRPMPQIDYDNPEILAPGRSSVQPQGQSHWYTRVNVAAYIGMEGCPHYTFPLCFPWDKEGRWNGPYQTLFRVATERAKAAKYNTVRGGWQADWNILLPSLGGGQDKGAPMSKPSAKGFMQASAVYVCGKKDYTTGDRAIPLGMNKDDDPIIIEVSGACGDQLMKLLDQRIETYEGDGEERPWEAFFYGDATGAFDRATRTVKGGLIIGIFDPKHYSSITKHTSWNGEIRPGAQSYEAALARSWKSPISKQTYRADMDAEMTAQVFKKYQFWYDDGKPGDANYAPGVVRVAPLQQQAVWVAQAFAGAPRLLEFVWAEKKEFLTQDVLKILRQRRSMAMPGSPEEYAGGDQTAPPRRAARTDPTQTAAAGQPPPRTRPTAAPPQTDEFADPVDETPAEGVEGDVDEFGDPGQIEAEGSEVPAGEELPPEDQTEGTAFEDDLPAEAAAEGFVEEPPEEEPIDEDPFPDDLPQGEAPQDELPFDEAPQDELPVEPVDNEVVEEYFGDPAAEQPPEEANGGGAFEEDQLIAEQQAGEAGDPEAQLTEAEQQMKDSMALARSRAVRRTSAPVTAPPARRPNPPPAQARQPAPATRPAPAATRPAPAATRPAPAPAQRPSGKPPTAPTTAATRPATAAPSAGRSSGTAPPKQAPAVTRTAPAVTRTAPAARPAPAAVKTAPAARTAPAATRTAPVATGKPAAAGKPAAGKSQTRPAAAKA